MYSIKYCNIYDVEFDLELDCTVRKIEFGDMNIKRIISLNLPILKLSVISSCKIIYHDKLF